MYEITVSRVFSAAHALRLYDGSMEALHGHNWSVELTVAAGQLDAIDVVMDFHELERSDDALMDRVQNRNLNDVEPFPPTMEEGFFRQGDILVSLRNINTVFVFNRHSRKIKLI